MPFSSLGPQAVQGDGSELRQGTVRVHDRRDEERDRAEGGRRRRQGVGQGRLLRRDHALAGRTEPVLEASLPIPHTLSLAGMLLFGAELEIVKIEFDHGLSS